MGVTVVWDTLFATVVVYEMVVESNILKSTPLNARDLRVASPDSSGLGESARVTVTVYVRVVLVVLSGHLDGDDVASHAQ